MAATSTGSVDPRTGRTRELLIGSAIKLFGAYGFDRTTVRQIADDAGVNIAAINYHFGAKEGLREAAVDAVAERMRSHGPARVLGSLSESAIAEMTADDVRAVLRDIMASSLSSNAVDRQLEEVRAFIQRELLGRGTASRQFYDKVFAAQLDVMSLLVSRILGTDPHDARTRMRALTVLGQSVFLRLARPLVLRAMDWSDVGDTELDIVRAGFWLTADDTTPPPGEA